MFIEVQTIKARFKRLQLGTRTTLMTKLKTVCYTLAENLFIYYSCPDTFQEIEIKDRRLICGRKFQSSPIFRLKCQYHFLGFGCCCVLFVYVCVRRDSQCE